MPGLAQRDDHQFSHCTSSLHSLSGPNGPVSANEFWSKHRDDVSYNQLQKFWSDLPVQGRKELLRIEKQTLFEQARKNMYCSRCNGLLLEGFMQIVMHGKSLQQEGAGGLLPCDMQEASRNQHNGHLSRTILCEDEVQDPSVHPWGGLTTTKDGALTLLGCYLQSKSLKGVQNVFDSARARERERELLYPDACGGGGRGWISQGMVGYGRGHGTRETCALHTARLSVDTLVDFWSALGEETRKSLLRMKEEDFIERLMYRFDSKRFCRDCRRNVIREFKELKELKRMRREPRCTSWFCAADTAFQYEVSHDTVKVDWHQTFSVGTYDDFEWAVGTGEGKSDILEFENVGSSGRVQVTGLDLRGLGACYITLRAWKMGGRRTELSVKAHALKGQQCVHCRLIVGDGFVTITQGESSRRFFERAEEAEEEEDDDSIDKDGNELDGECSRPQKHAKSPELAREFLLDAATIIFKEQVEKAFREGTARQNAHSIFVCLALKLLEERLHVACKEIITLEKQIKLLEEEEKEKREEEERRERRRTKEREKKLRRKERLRSKEMEREKKSCEANQSPLVLDVPMEEVSPSVHEQQDIFNNSDSIFETGDISSSSKSPDTQDEQLLNGSIFSTTENHSDDSSHGEFCNIDMNFSFTTDHSRVSHQRLKFQKELQTDPTLKWSERGQAAVVSDSGNVFTKSEDGHYGDNFSISSKSASGLNKQLRSNSIKSNIRTSGSKFGERFRSASNRVSNRYNYHACSCNQHDDYRVKVETHTSATRIGKETKSVSKSECVSDISKQYYRTNKYNQVDYIPENGGRTKSKTVSGANSFTRDLYHIKKVWEPMESQRKYPRSNSETDVTLRSSTFKDEGNEPHHFDSSGVICSDEVTEKLDESGDKENILKGSRNSSTGVAVNHQNRFHVEAKGCHYTKEGVDELCRVPASPSSGNPSMSSTSNSDNCSSCLSEEDSTMASSNSPNSESLSSSDSEDASQHSEGRETSVCVQENPANCHEAAVEKKQIVEQGEAFGSRTLSENLAGSARNDIPINLQTKTSQNLENGRNVSLGFPHQSVLPPMHNQSIPFPVFHAPSTMGYFHQSPVSWPAASANGWMPFPHSDHYVIASPFGYGFNENSHYTPYGSLQHLTPPQLNPGEVPIYHPVVKINGMDLKDETKISKPGGPQMSLNERTKERAIPAGQRPPEELPSKAGGRNGDSNKLPKTDPGFSLFHFGGPVALSTGCRSDTVPPKNGIAGDLSSDIPADHVQADRDCNMKDTIEEYNLFASNNGIRFSIF